jgi:hypothetical protein
MASYLPDNSKQYERIFKKLEVSQRKLKYFNPDSTKSLDWFFSIAKEAAKRTVQPTTIMASDANKLRPIKDLRVGEMLFYFYDPKYKDELPYYDTFPLVIPFAFREDGQGFYGINVHYLYPRTRLELIQALQPYKSNYQDRQRIAWNYQILQNATQFEVTKHAVKSYRYDHVQSQAFRINYADWPNAVMLPVERFVKSKKHAVWAHSL